MSSMTSDAASSSTARAEIDAALQNAARELNCAPLDSEERIQQLLKERAELETLTDAEILARLAGPGDSHLWLARLSQTRISRLLQDRFGEIDRCLTTDPVERLRRRLACLRCAERWSRARSSDSNESMPDDAFWIASQRSAWNL